MMSSFCLVLHSAALLQLGCELRKDDEDDEGDEPAGGKGGKFLSDFLDLEDTLSEHNGHGPALGGWGRFMVVLCSIRSQS